MRKLNAQTDKEPNMWKAFADFAAPTNRVEELYLIAKLAAIILRCDYVDGLLCLNMQM